MKYLREYISESIFDQNNIKKKTVLEKLTRALKTVFNDNLTVCKDYQGDSKKESSWYYEINPETLGGGVGNSYNAKRFINYCNKIDGIKVEQVQGILGGGYTFIGDDQYWIKVFIDGRLLRKITISKDFFESGVFPVDQSKVAQRGWNRWAGRAW